MPSNQICPTLKVFAQASLFIVFAVQGLPAHAGASATIEEIVVTGTRIPVQSSEFPTPTTTIDTEVLESAGTVNLGDVLHEYPAMVGGIGGSNDAGIVTAGRELLNLRGLGIARTLVLVNGRRQVPGDLGTGAVDIAMIPVPLVERVEIITGGASAIYGADAVTGVVNIILKDEFEGLQVDVLGGVSERGDGERGNLSLTWGRNFAGDRGNVVLSASYTDEARVAATARSYSDRDTGFIQNPANTGPSDGIPDALFQDDLKLRAFSRQGILHLVNNADSNLLLPMQELAFSLPLFAGDAIGLGTNPILGFGLQPGEALFDSFTRDPDTGVVRPFVSGEPCDVFFCRGGDGVNLNSFEDISVPFERAAVSLNGRYDFDALTLRMNGRYGRTESRGQGQFTIIHDFIFGPFARIERDNPFLPPAMAAEMDARDLTAAPLATVGLGLESHNAWDSWQLTMVGEGELWQAAEFEFYGQYGASELASHFQDALLSRYFQALDATTDATGTPVCRDPSNGCAPYDPFAGELSGAALEFAGVDVRTTARLTQLLFGTSVNGAGPALPAGPLKYAFGAEYRRETSKTVYDELLQAIDPATGFGAGLIGFTASGTPEQNLFFPSERGHYDVAEAFAEVLLPLVQGRTLIEDLDLSLAARYADYSTIGSDVSYKAGLNWTLGDTVRVRSTYSRAVRAPNITELFAPATRRGQFVSDPCDADQLDAGSNPSNRQANCAALGLPPDFFSLANNTTRPVTQTGNRDLNEEEAHTVTVGAVVTLGQNLSVAVDYWDMDIDGAITQFSATETLENCVDGATLDPLFCDLVSRSADGQIININVQQVNAAEFVASGVDLEINYSHFFDHGGSLSLSTIATYTDKLTFFQSADDPDSKDERAGALLRPRFRGLLRTSYAVDRWQVGWDVNYVGRTKISNDVQPEQLSLNRIKAEVYHDLNLRFIVRDGIEVYGGVNNVTDNKPPLFLNAGSTLYDGVGRYYFGGIRVGMP